MQRLEPRPLSLINYLDQVLFDPVQSGICQQNTELGNRILDLFKRYAPHKLSALVLESNLKRYSRTLAMRLLDDSRFSSDMEHVLQPIENDKFASWKARSPKNSFAHALVTLDRGNSSQCLHILKNMEPQCIVEFTVHNSYLLLQSHVEQAQLPPATAHSISPEKKRSLLFEDDEQLLLDNIPNKPENQLHKPQFAELLCQHLPWCLMEVLVRLASSIPVSNALVLLAKHPKHGHLLQQIYLLSLLRERKRHMSEEMFSAAQKLMELWLDTLTHQPSEDDVQMEQRFKPEINEWEESLVQARNWCSFLNFSFIGNCPQWLQQLPLPLLYLSPIEPEKNNASGLDEQLQQEPLLYDPHTLQVQDATFIAYTRATSPSQFAFYKRFVLLNVQGMLSTPIFSGKPIEDIWKRLQPKQEGEKEQFEGHLSLQVLCLKQMGLLEAATDLLLQQQPSLCVDFAKACFGSSLSMWKNFLEKLLTNLRGNEQSLDRLEPALEQTLWHLAGTLEPEPFLSILPSDGNVEYFLQFLKHCYGVQSGKQAARDLSFYGDPQTVQ